MSTAMLVLGVMAATLPGSAATSGSVVGANVLGATTLDTTLCATGDPTRTTFGTLTSGTSLVTADDCDVLFGSSNSTATLRTFMPARRASALMASPTNVTENGNGNRILDLDMIDASNGWSAGDGNVNNRVRQTTDGGDTWNTIATPLGGSARTVSAPTTSTIWIARYSFANVIRSDNGGSSWYSRTFPGVNARAHAIHGKDDLVAWAAGQIDDGTVKPRLWHTIDGGTTWNIVCDETCSTSQWTDIVMIPGTNTGWAVNQTGQIWATTNGTTWTVQTDTGSALQAIDAYDASHAIAVGSGGQVIRTINGGTNWSWDEVNDVRFALRDVSYRSTGVVWAAGDFGFIARSANHGADWTLIASRVEPTQITNIEALGDNSIQATSHDETFFRTANAGSTWQVATSPVPGTNWADHDGPDGTTMWRVGTRGQIEKTTDGTTWVAQTSTTTEALYGVAALDRQVAVAVGANGTILRTVNGGTTWTTVPSGTTQTLRAISVSRADHLWIVGEGGTILRSADGGVTITTVTSGTTDPLSAVATYTGDTVLVGTADGELRRTTDTGATWSTVAGNPTTGTPVSALRAVPLTSTFWATWGAYAARSTDGGSSWTSTSMGNGGFAHDIDAVDATTAWIAGRFGAVRRTTNGGGAWTLFTGPTGTRNITSVVAHSRDDVSLVGEGEFAGSTTPGSASPDYGDAGATWAGANGHFGICLRTIVIPSGTWPYTGSCPTSDGTNWRALPDHGGLAASAVATTLGTGNVTASFRFGIKVPSSLPAGTYSAPIAFEVTSP